ncbi:MAG: hypothetical protein ISS70_12715 [Phycisphaerae bacterium]|nr:hypothetical protein [Phycisphaerae bacterium]
MNCDFFEPAGADHDPHGGTIAKWGVCRDMGPCARRARGSSRRTLFMWDYEICGDYEPREQTK